MLFQKGHFGSNRGAGEAHRWLVDRATYQGCDCLIWPFAKESRSGRGTFGHEGKTYSARTYMCELAHGPKPTPSHKAALSCDGGKAGCINPRHLSWQTFSDVQRRRYQRNSTRGRVSSITSLTPAEIQRIQAKAESQLSLAAALKVSLGCIQYWQRDRATRGHDVGPVTRRRAFGIIPVRSSIIGAPTDEAEALAAIYSMVPHVRGRDDIYQDIVLAVLEGRTTLAQLQAGGIRPFMTKFHRENFEQRGFALSLDVPMRDGRSWHDVLEAR